MEERLPKGTLGGQAVLEGVMMKGPKRYAVAVRKPDQKIEVKLEEYESIGERFAFCKIPFIRGVVNFAESLVIGMQTLTYSSSFYEEEEEETKVDKMFKEVFKEKAESVIIGFTVLVSVVIAIALFMMLPAFLAEFTGKYIENNMLVAVIEGFIRLFIFLLYVVLIAQMNDIKRVFMYHGAEHKTINCYEAGEDLTPENVAKHKRYHKRCGTSFLFVVMIVSIFVFMFIQAEQMWMRFLLRLVLVPVVASISYEFIRFAGRSDSFFFNLLSQPGMWVQKLTTKEPTEEMIQVAIISVEATLFGKPYVKAVNEAQGIFVDEEEELEEETTDMQALDENMDELEEAESDETEEAVKNDSKLENSEMDGATDDEEVEVEFYEISEEQEDVSEEE